MFLFLFYFMNTTNITSNTTNITSNTSHITRPRFRRSKHSGFNLRMHPRYSNFLTPCLGMFHSALEPKRINSINSMNVALRSCLKDFYDLRKSKITGSTFVRATSPWNIKNIDRRIDILLHRSGLTNSIKQSRQLISHGHVFAISNSKSSKIILPSYTVPINTTTIFIRSSILPHVTKMSNSQWTNWNPSASTSSNQTYNSRYIPPYIEVDYVNACFTLINNPCKDTILIPAGLGKTVSMCIYNKLKLHLCVFIHSS